MLSTLFSKPEYFESYCDQESVSEVPPARKGKRERGDVSIRFP
jgi:hypothetical protein